MLIWLAIQTIQRRPSVKNTLVLNNSDRDRYNIVLHRSSDEASRGQVSVISSLDMSEYLLNFGDPTSIDRKQRECGQVMVNSSQRNDLSSTRSDVYSALEDASGFLYEESPDYRLRRSRGEVFSFDDCTRAPAQNKPSKETSMESQFQTHSVHSEDSQHFYSQDDRVYYSQKLNVNQVNNSTPNAEAYRLLNEMESRIQQTRTELSQMEAKIKRQRHCVRSNQTKTTRRISNVHSE
jgi:hypothetical protein